MELIFMLSFHLKRVFIPHQMYPALLHFNVSRSNLEVLCSPHYWVLHTGSCCCWQFVAEPSRDWASHLEHEGMKDRGQCRSEGCDPPDGHQKNLEVCDVWWHYDLMTPSLRFHC